MTDKDAVAAPTRRRGQGLWLTVGEGVAVLALVVAGLNFWDSHQQRVEESRHLRVQPQSVLLAVGEADAEGRSIAIQPLKATQTIQSQTYLFPSDFSDRRPPDVVSPKPRIELDWIARDLRRVLDQARARDSGEARLPVVIATSYLEDGGADTPLSDRTLYDIAFTWKRGFLGGWDLRLKGLTLVRRLGEKPTPEPDLRWKALKSAIPARDGNIAR